MSLAGSSSALRPMGSFLRLVMAGSRGIARAPVPLGRIDLGPDEDDLARHLEHFRASPEDLNVEQTGMWGALCLYCLARCATAGRSCPLLAASFTPSQVATIRKGIDFWRMKEVAGAREAGLFVEQLTVVEPPPDSAEPDDERVEGGPALPPVEIEWLRPRGDTCRFRVRLNQDVEFDPEKPLIGRFLVADPIDVSATVVGAAAEVTSQGTVGILVDDEWQEIGLRFVGLGDRRVRRIELVDLRDGPGQAIDVPPDSHPPHVMPAPPSIPRSEEAAATESQPAWAASIEGEERRALLLQLAKHGSVTEAEATRILGSPRAQRRFSAEFEAIMTKVPFRVRIETTDDGKRFVREGDR